jgi:hypothetical protein
VLKGSEGDAAGPEPLGVARIDAVGVAVADAPGVAETGVGEAVGEAETADPDGDPQPRAANATPAIRARRT